MDDSAEPERVRPEDMRAGDADRELMVERLRTAHAEGRLDVAEFDERITAALAARTYGELAALSADLPGGPPTPRPLGIPVPRPPQAQRVERATGRDMSADDLRRGAVAWGLISFIAIALWAAVSIASGALIFPWWLLVAGPWAGGLLWSWRQLRRGGQQPGSH